MVKPKTSTYKIFGTCVLSELELPEGILCSLTPEVTISFGSVPERIEYPLFEGTRFQVSAEEFLLKVEGVACYHINRGKSITIDRSEGGSDDEVRLFLLGSAFGALIHQRGMLPIHGSAIQYKNKVIIFAGRSGAGKSTLAASFLKKGYKLLADDVCVITIDDRGKPIVHPGYPQLKLWDDALDQLGNNPNYYHSIRRGVKKYSVPLHSDFQNEPAELQEIYVLSGKESDPIEIKTLLGIEKFNALNTNTYCLGFLKGNSLLSSHFKHVTTISNFCEVKQVNRPASGYQLQELTSIIENDFTR